MGGCRCSFRGCPNSSSNFKCLHFFHYPVKDVDRCAQWIRNSHNPSFTSLTTSKLKNKVVCQFHFEEKYFINYRCERLTPAAIPTLMPTDKGIENVALSDSTGENDLVTRTVVANVQADVDIDFTPADIDDTKLVVVDRGSSGLLFSNLSKEKVIVDVSFKDLMIKYKSSDIIPRQTLLNKQYSKSSRIINKVGNYSTSAVGGECYSDTDKTKTISSRPLKKPRTVVTYERIDNSNHLDNLFLDFEPIQQPKSPHDVDVLAVLAKQEASITKSDLARRPADVILLCEKPMDVEQVEYLVDDLAPTQSGRLEVGENKGSVIQKSPEHSYINEIHENTSQIAALKRLFQSNTTDRKDQKSPKRLSTRNVKHFRKTVNTNLSKVQLFNGIKKYLSPTVASLLRMELFGSRDRSWRPDEKDLSLELFSLGDNVYEYLAEELRWRLPPKNLVETWEREYEHSDLEEMMKE